MSSGETILPRLFDIFAPSLITIPCVNRRCGRFGVRAHADVAHELRPEARIDQVQDGVLDAADVLVNGEPVIDDLAVEGRTVIVRVGVAIEVPGRIDERVHGVGLATRRAATLRTRRVHELRHALERRSALQRDVDVLRQEHRQAGSPEPEQRRPSRNRSSGWAYPSNAGVRCPNPSSG